MARCSSSGGCCSDGSTRPSAASARAVSASSRGPRWDGASGFGYEGFGVVGGIGNEQQALAQFGPGQGLLAVTVEADAALEGGQRFVQAQLAAFHARHQLLERVQRVLEVGDGRGFRGGWG